MIIWSLVMYVIHGIITNVLIFAPHQTPLFVQNVNKLFSLLYVGSSSRIITFSITFFMRVMHMRVPHPHHADNFFIPRFSTISF